MSEVLTTDEVLLRLRITRKTLYNWMEEGLIAPVKLARKKRHKLLFREEDVDRLLSRVAVTDDVEGE